MYNILSAPMNFLAHIKIKMDNDPQKWQEEIQISK